MFASVFFVIFLFFLFLIIIGGSILRGILNLLLGRRTTRRRRYTQQTEQTEQYEQSDRMQRDSSSGPKKREKIFDSSDGEYVDFEELS